LKGEAKSFACFIEAAQPWLRGVVIVGGGLPPIRWTVRSRRMSSPLELRWTDLADRRVPSTLIVEDLDVVEQLHLGFTVAVEPLAELAFQT